MGIGVSVFLIAVGAILTFAVNASVSGINIATVGVILMVVGGIGLLWSAIVMGTAGYRSRGTVVEGPGRRTVVDDY
jgi:protein-S-isoprenylcysteine O-methyltransferase Ste14